MSHLLLLMHLILVTMPVAANPKEDIKTNNGSETELTRETEMINLGEILAG